jgi:RNA polymerase sigma-70 factor (ECF subfamily)
MTEAPPTAPSLLVRIRDERDGDSWSRFVFTYQPLVSEFLRRQGLQEADAADLTQEVLARVAAAIKSFEYEPQRGAFRGWLFTIVKNCQRRFYEHRKIGQQGSGDTRVMHVLAEVPAADADEDEWNLEYERHLLARAAREVRGDFRDETWQAFWATAVDGRSAQSAASELSMSVAAVYMAKHRVTSRLREHIRYLEGGDT